MTRPVLGWIWEMLISTMTLRIPACATGWGGVKFTGDVRYSAKEQDLKGRSCVNFGYTEFGPL